MWSGLQKMGPTRPNGSGQIIFGWTKLYSNQHALLNTGLLYMFSPGLEIPGGQMVQPIGQNPQ